MGKRLTLCVFIDALGWEILQRHSFLDDIVVEKRPLNTVFGYSSTCDPTIITGKMPRDHGHFAFFTYDPENSPFGWYKYTIRCANWHRRGSSNDEAKANRASHVPC